MESHRIEVGELALGTKVFAEGLYWDKSIEVAGEIVGVTLVGGQPELKLQAGGTPDERLLRWLSGQEERGLRCHLCPAGCTNSPVADDYIHLKKLRRLVPPGEKTWPRPRRARA